MFVLYLYVSIDLKSLHLTIILSSHFVSQHFTTLLLTTICYSCIINQQQTYSHTFNHPPASPLPINQSLHHSQLTSLSEFSDENMMDPYNLAICFGPTLMPIPSQQEQVLYQNHVTEVKGRRCGCFGGSSCCDGRVGEKRVVLVQCVFK